MSLGAGLEAGIAAGPAAGLPAWWLLVLLAPAAGSFLAVLADRLAKMLPPGMVENDDPTPEEQQAMQQPGLMGGGF